MFRYKMLDGEAAGGSAANSVPLPDPVRATEPDRYTIWLLMQKEGSPVL